MFWIFLVFTVFVALSLSTFGALVSNYRAAINIGLPIIISPVSPLSTIWILTWRAFPKVLALRYLPFGLGTWARCTYLGWNFNDKHALHDELGSVFVVVTPGGNEIHVADPEAAHTILSRRKEYIKPAVMYEQLNVFGPNLNTVEGDNWQRQRRLTAPSFNEKTSSLVWNEALNQTEDMIQSWLKQGKEGTREVVADTATLALHVLTSVGFGLSYPFHGGVRNISPGHTMTYRDALSICLRNIITFAIFPGKLLSQPFVPKKLQAIGLAAREFQQYMEEMLAHERSVKKGGSSSGNLMGALVKASIEEGGMAQPLSLSDDEIFGNIFAFNLAGHETTANTVAAAIVLLAAYPEHQDWLAEGLDGVVSLSDGTWEYEKVFSQLKRCLAVMHETLRLYGSIVFIPKSTGSHAQTILLDGKPHNLHSNTTVNINVQALHTDPQTWKPDPLAWRPSRWLEGPNQSFITPQAGSFIPWADGPRVCVGKKFSQVEFVAVLAKLFSRYRVSPALSPEQNADDARRALLDMVNDSAISAITLQMRDSRRIPLVWKES